jgi:hypothetical protein
MTFAASSKHRPASHPVLRALPTPEPTRPSLDSRVDLDARIERIARLLANLPDQPLTQRNRTEMAIIARELMRRVES